jgi:CyaY protein
MKDPDADADLSREIEKTLDSIQRRVDGLGLDDLEVDAGPGRLDVTCLDGARIILSRQSATNQIWLAEPGGGWHFDARGGRWVCDKRGVDLMATLELLLTTHCGVPIRLG